MLWIAGLAGGIVLSLAKQEYPDTSAYTDPEITVRIRKAHHAGLIVSSPDAARIRHLLDAYMRRFHEDYFRFDLSRVERGRHLRSFLITYVAELERQYKAHRAKVYHGENYYVSGRANVRQMLLDRIRGAR